MHAKSEVRSSASPADADLRPLIAPPLRAKRRTGMMSFRRVRRETLLLRQILTLAALVSLAVSARSGERGAKVLAVYVVEKGKPLATPAP